MRSVLSRHKPLGGQENASLRRQNPLSITLTFPQLRRRLSNRFRQSLALPTL
jgi:hypothetical protein